MINLTETGTPSFPFYHITPWAMYPHLTQAIFTRLGGVSQPPYQWLNVSVTIGDTPQAVAENFQRLCAAVDVPPSQTATCHLIHGADILTIDEANFQPMMGRVDGLITATPGLFLTMRFADCVPLLFFDPIGQAVGVSHAGWRGTVQQIAVATVEAMQQLGCRPADIQAVVGPSIGPCCYEVGAEVIEAVKMALPQGETLFHRQWDGKTHFDLWAANRQQLERAGVGHIIMTETCTACHHDKFFSHRAEKGRTGRFGVIIGLQ